MKSVLPYATPGWRGYSGYVQAHNSSIFNNLRSVVRVLLYVDTMNQRAATYYVGWYARLIAPGGSGTAELIPR